MSTTGRRRPVPAKAAGKAAKKAPHIACCAGLCRCALRVAKRDLEAMLHRVPNVMDLDPLVVAHRLNQRPTWVYREFVWPDRAMRERVAAL